jgi:hypothetical protein
MITLTREEAQQVLDVIERNIVGVPRYRATELLRARLAKQTPYEVGQRLYREGKGISFIPTAVERDDQIGEALRGFEDARLSAPEPEPVAWMNEGDIGKTDWKVWAHGKPTATIPLYAVPQEKNT